MSTQSERVLALAGEIPTAGYELLNELRTFISRFCVFPDELELPRFRGQFIACAIMKCFTNHSASNPIPKARAVRPAR